MKLSEIHIRDPYILPYEGSYYLFGTPGACSWGGQDGFFYCKSSDLKDWTEPVRCFQAPADFWADTNFWAPEVHYYHGKSYMIASFYRKDKKRKRSVQILKADSPEGPYFPFSNPITPEDWMSLDGTLHFENGVPYMIFCHEWTQIHDGEMCAFKLSDDLSKAAEPPVLLFRASEPEWADEKQVNGFVTDGPYMHRNKDGKLLMIWSSFCKTGYALAVAVSEDGTLNGKWHHCKNLFYSSDGGHGMILNTFDGRMFLVLHSPNGPAGKERTKLIEITETASDPFLKPV